MKLLAPSRVLPPVSAGAREREAEGSRFEQFVRDHQDMVFATAVRLLGRAEDAEDVAQDVFLKAYERFAMLERSAAAAGWLRTVARNACLNYLVRHRARFRLFSEMPETEGQTFTERIEARPATAGADDEHQRREADLEVALRHLPDHQRVPLVLFHFEALSYQDIADALGVSLGKVKTDIHRGREALRQHLSAHGSR